MVIDIKFFTMVNIIADKRVYEEFLQGDVNAKILSDSVEKILLNGERRKDVEKDIKNVVHSLSLKNENPSKKAATAIMTVLG